MKGRWRERLLKVRAKSQIFLRAVMGRINGQLAEGWVIPQVVRRPYSCISKHMSFLANCLMYPVVFQNPLLDVFFIKIHDKNFV